MSRDRDRTRIPLRDLSRVTRRAARGLFEAFAEIGGARLYPPQDARAAAHRLAAAAGAIARAHELAVTVHGDIPRAPALVVTHRVGDLASLALLPVCPAIPVAPAAVRQWPVVRSLARAFGVAFITRADPMARARALRRVHDLLAAGVSVIDYALPAPRDHTHPIGAFRRGSFGIAARLGIPVVPVAIRYRDPTLAAATATSATRRYLQLAARPRLEIELHFGAPMWPRAGEPPEVMADRARHRIARALRVVDAVARLRVA